MNPNNSFDDTNVTIECDSVTLNELTLAYFDFLAACGFSYKTIEEMKEDLGIQ